jgi:glycosyltransferase involved in cell wall biosynthesis
VSNIPPLISVSDMKILLSSASFAPSYGGPAYSVRSLAEALSSLGHVVGVWAPDGSAKKKIAPGAQESCKMSPHELANSLSSAITDFGIPDIFHDSGLWWWHNRLIASTARRLRRPFIISVRGMLEPAALRHHAWKKNLAWLLYQKRDLESAAAVHVTGALEAQNVRTLGLTPRIACVPNGLNVQRDCPTREPLFEKRVAFLGRLHPIKGLPMLLEAWSRVGPSDWRLEIAGPDEGGYRSVLENQVRSLGLDGVVTFSGPTFGVDKAALFARTSAFVLPSYSESFGVAVGEALAEGIPVIATEGSPWACLQTEECGWYVPASVAGLEAGIKELVQTAPEDLLYMGRRGHAYVANAFSWKRVAREMDALYKDVLSKDNVGR